MIVRARIRSRVRVSAQIKVEQVLPDTIETDFEADKLTPEFYEQVQFTDKSSLSPSKWIYGFGDGNYSELQNPKHRYSEKGKKTIVLHAGSTGTSVSDAGNVEEKTDYIDVKLSAFVGTIGGVKNDSLNAASEGDSVEVVEGKEDPNEHRDLSQTTSSKQPVLKKTNNCAFVLKGDGSDDFMRFLNISRTEWEDLLAQGTFSVTFYAEPDSDTSGEVEFGYDGVNERFIVANGNGPQVALIIDSNGNQKRYDSQTDRRGKRHVITAVFKEAGDFVMLINGMDEAVLNTDQSPDFSNVDLSNNAEGPLYLNQSGATSFIDYPVSTEILIRDANEVANGHHLVDHQYLRDLYGV